MLLIDAERSDKWYTGNKVHTKAHEKLPYEIAMEKNAIPYDENPALWHWSHRVRPVRCATDLTIYRNTTSTGITVTDSGLEGPTSFKDTFGATAERSPDLNFVIGHTTPSKLVFSPPSCGREGRHGICPQPEFNLTESEFYYGSVLVHLNSSMWKEGCCLDVVPQDTTLQPFGHCRVSYVSHCSMPPPPPSPPPPSPQPSSPPPPPAKSTARAAVSAALPTAEAAAVARAVAAANAAPAIPSPAPSVAPTLPPSAFPDSKPKSVASDDPRAVAPSPSSIPSAPDAPGPSLASSAFPSTAVAESTAAKLVAASVAATGAHYLHTRTHRTRTTRFKPLRRSINAS